MLPNVHIVPILGPPGAGKTTFCRWMSEPKAELRPGNAPRMHHILLTDVMRRNKDQMPERLRELFDAGGSLTLHDAEMVDYTFRLLLSQIYRLLAEDVMMADCLQCGRNQKDLRQHVVIVDGFPRNGMAAEYFEDKFGPPLAVLEFQVDEDVAEERLTGRERDVRDLDANVRRERREKNLGGIGEIAWFWQCTGVVPWMTTDTSELTMPDGYFHIWDQWLRCPWFQRLWLVEHSRPRANFAI